MKARVVLNRKKQKRLVVLNEVGKSETVVREGDKVSRLSGAAGGENF